MNKPHRYEICIQGILSDNWSDWLDGLTIKSQSDCETTLNGYLTDQAALLGVLARIHTLNLKIISVQKENKNEAR